MKANVGGGAESNRAVWGGVWEPGVQTEARLLVTLRRMGVNMMDFNPAVSSNGVRTCSRRLHAMAWPQSGFGQADLKLVVT